MVPTEKISLKKRSLAPAASLTLPSAGFIFWFKIFYQKIPSKLASGRSLKIFSFLRNKTKL